MENTLNTIPNISIDCVIFGFDFEKLNVLLVERSLNDENGVPVFCDHTLVGHHVKTDETLDESAARILREMTGLTNIYLEQFQVFGNPNRLNKSRSKTWLESIGRDPKLRVFTVGYFSLVNVNKVQISYTERNANWFDVENIEELGFDHNEIIEKALIALRRKIKTHPIVFELLPLKFTLSQLQKLYEVILNIEIDKRNFRKKISSAPYIVALIEKQKNVPHKPAQLYMFSNDIYEATKKKDFNFFI